MHSSSRLILAGLALAAALNPSTLASQQKSTFSSRQEALAAGRELSGGGGPRGVTWIDGGNRYSYTDRADSGGEVIRSFDPASGRDELLFSHLTLPTSDLV